jgi:hypothetical protein
MPTHTAWLREKTLWNSTGREVTPAYLSQTAALTDVKLQWRKIG